MPTGKALPGGMAEDFDQVCGGTGAIDNELDSHVE